MELRHLRYFIAVAEEGSLSIGLLGIYIGKIFVQTRGRPVYVVKRVL